MKRHSWMSKCFVNVHMWISSIFIVFPFFIVYWSSKVLFSNNCNLKLTIFHIFVPFFYFSLQNKLSFIYRNSLKFYTHNHLFQEMFWCDFQYFSSFLKAPWLSITGEGQIVYREKFCKCREFGTDYILQMPIIVFAVLYFCGIITHISRWLLADDQVLYSIFICKPNKC